MRCPKCDSLEDKVIDSRLSKEGSSIRRRRECLDCDTRFTTYEEIERVELRVVKRDGRHEPFDRHKLLNSFLKACEKRPISIDVIERSAESIQNDFETAQEREVDTREVGLRVMQKLHELDPVAYVRYASVYREFQEIGDFIDEIQSFGKYSTKVPAQAELFSAS